MLDSRGGGKPYVFLSYASADRERALQVADRLEGHGIPVWIDPAQHRGRKRLARRDRPRRINA